MTFKSPQSLKTIAELINAKFIGDENFQVFGTNEIHRVKAGEIVFVNHPKYYVIALFSEATIILIDKEVDCPEGKALLQRLSLHHQQRQHLHCGKRRHHRPHNN